MLACIGCFLRDCEPHMAEALMHGLFTGARQTPCSALLAVVRRSRAARNFLGSHGWRHGKSTALFCQMCGISTTHKCTLVRHSCLLLPWRLCAASCLPAVEVMTPPGGPEHQAVTAWTSSCPEALPPAA